MSPQYAVVFFANDSDQTMSDACGPFRSLAKAEAAMDKLDEVMQPGACPQLVTLSPLGAILSEMTD